METSSPSAGYPQGYNQRPMTPCFRMLNAYAQDTPTLETWFRFGRVSDTAKPYPMLNKSSLTLDKVMAFHPHSLRLGLLKIS
jgi:hypothetical protein